MNRVISVLFAIAALTCAASAGEVIRPWFISEVSITDDTMFDYAVGDTVYVLSPAKDIGRGLPIAIVATPGMRDTTTLTGLEIPIKRVRAVSGDTLSITHDNTGRKQFVIRARGRQDPIPDFVFIDGYDQSQFEAMAAVGIVPDGQYVILGDRFGFWDSVRFGFLSSEEIGGQVIDVPFLK